MGKKRKSLMAKILSHVKVKRIQDNYDVECIKVARKISIFLIPPRNNITGGIMSIFNMCLLTKENNKDMLSVVSTIPGFKTYSKNTHFKNNERIYNFSQIINNCCKEVELIFHIPEYLSKNFYKSLKKSEITKLQSIKKIRINILNQNIDMMPNVEAFQNLHKITQDVVHSVSFKRLTTQNICNKYGLPLFYTKSYIELNNNLKKPFKEKEKLILYSKDLFPMKQRILTMIQKSLPDFKLELIEGLTHQQYLQKISNAAFCITFGEGFDGYYIEPYFAGSIGITVYNDKFFPENKFKNLPFVYRSYSELYHNIVDDILRVYNDENEYNKISLDVLLYLQNSIEEKEATIKGLQDIYIYKNPLFLPQENATKAFLPNKESILTVIIFTYNHEEYIEKCIRSIVDQETSYRYEIHIWDDASVDNTSNICLKYAKKYPDKIDLIIQDKNTFCGQYEQMQSLAAIKKVDTKYFCVIDGDDCFVGNKKIQKSLDFLESNPSYIGFAHDTMEVNLFNNTSKSYIHDLLKWKVKNPVTLDSSSPFLLTSSRVFRNIGYGDINVLPIDYLLYYYHLSNGPIYYHDEIMGSYKISQSSTFASMTTEEIKDANYMFPFKLSKLFGFKQDKFCTDLLKHYTTIHGANKIKYNSLIWLKRIFGVKKGWKKWFSIHFIRKYGKKSKDIHYVFCHKSAKSKSDSIAINNNK